MKITNYFKSILAFTFVTTSLLFTSCGSDNSILETPDDAVNEYNVTVNSTNFGTGDRFLKIEKAPKNTTVSVGVHFTKEDKNMNRLYVTKNVSGSGEGAVAYDLDPEKVLKLNKKGDGSLDLEGDQEDEFNFTIDFPTPTEENATIQYVIWTTSSRGDFRDITNDNAFTDNAYATVTITAGTKAELSGIRTFTQTVLAAPLADASSKTFVSAFNGKVYAIKEGQETAALWDFGFYYDKNTYSYGKHGAAFYSTTTFPSTGFTESIKSITGLEKSELNKCYFRKSSKTTLEFNNVTTSAELESITTPSSQDVKNLIVGDVVEFVDQYGNKGLIKITDLVADAGARGKITFDVKVQSNAIPLAQ